MHMVYITSFIGYPSMELCVCALNEKDLVSYYWHLTRNSTFSFGQEAKCVKILLTPIPAQAGIHFC